MFQCEDSNEEEPMNIVKKVKTLKNSKSENI